MPRVRTSHVEADRPIARRIGTRIRQHRLRVGMTQAELAAPRYTKAYISALENGLIKPSVAALSYIAARLGVSLTTLMSDEDRAWARLEADLALAAGDWDRALGAYQDLLEETTDPAATAEIKRGIAESLCRLDRGLEAIGPAADAMAWFESVGRASDATLAMYWLAGAHHLADNPTEARAIFLDLEGRLQRGVAGATPDFYVRVLIALAVVEGREGRPEAALAYLEAARVRAGELDDRRRAAFLHSLAVNYRELGDTEGAISTGTQSLALYRALEGEAEIAALDNELALSYLALGDRTRATEHAEASVERLEAIADTRALAHATDTLAQVRLAGDDPVGAAEAASRALELARATGNRKAEISAALSLARAMRGRGDLDEAERLLAAAAQLAEATERPAQLRDVLAEWSDVAAARGDLSRALDLSRRALETTRPARVPEAVAPDVARPAG